jgi:hypothetical protein
MKLCHGYFLQYLVPSWLFIRSYYELSRSYL